MQAVVVIAAFLAAFAGPFRAGLAGEGIVPLPVEEIAVGVFFAEGEVALPNAENRGAISNCGFIIGREAVAVIDTGGSYHVGLRLKAAIQARTALPVRYVINTHMHPDHVFGNAAFAGEGVSFVGHHKLKRGLAVRGETFLRNYGGFIGARAFAGTKIVLPDVAVTGQMQLDLGGRVIELTAYDTAHTDNDLTVRDVATRTLFTGDLLFVRHLPVLDGNLNGWLAVSEKLAGVEAAQAVPGHGGLQRNWPEALHAQTAYLTRLRDDVRAAIREGRSMRQAVSSVRAEKSGGWKLLEDYHRRNVTAGYAELEWE